LGEFRKALVNFTSLLIFKCGNDNETPKYLIAGGGTTADSAARIGKLTRTVLYHGGEERHKA
jgi:hypothetical protein